VQLDLIASHQLRILKVTKKNRIKKSSTLES
jgi:hypothetical protein